MKLFLILPFSTLLCSISFAVMMDSFTASGVVKNFDKEIITVLTQERLVQIPRKAVTGKFQLGQTVEFSLSGEQVSRIFFAKKKPASLPNH